MFHFLCFLFLLLLSVTNVYAVCTDHDGDEDSCKGETTPGCPGTMTNGTCFYTMSNTCECRWDCGSNQIDTEPACAFGSACCDSDCLLQTSGSCDSPDETGECWENLGECDASSLCKAVPKSAGDSCGSSTNNACNGRDTCDGSGTCQANLATDGTQCGGTPATCKAQGICSGGSCSISNLPDGTVCNTLSNPRDCEQAQQTCRSGNCRSVPQSTGFKCSNAANICKKDGVCNGSTFTCPTQANEPNNKECYAGGSGLNRVCDPRLTCNNGACPSRRANTVKCADAPDDACSNDRRCSNFVCQPQTYKSASTRCRTAPGGSTCELDVYCTGTTASCPARKKKTKDTICRSSKGDCDPAEMCDGVAFTCPADAKLPKTHECRKSEGICDPAENCDGTNASCPVDKKEPKSKVCRAAAGNCDEAEFCTGNGNTCPADLKKPENHVCRASAGLCDIVEYCDNMADVCPPDVVQPESTECRPIEGVCDVTEVCDGKNATCPPDLKAPMSQVCRDIAGPCDKVEFCDGTTNDCPPDAFNEGVVCRAAEEFQDCDVDEICQPGQASCPQDVPKQEGSVCTDYNEKTHDDKCNSEGVCKGRCKTDAECFDMNECTEDNCQAGVCVPVQIEGCERMPTPAPVTSCSTSDRYRFDLLQSYKEGDVPPMLNVCGFTVRIASTKPDAALLAREVEITGGRATRFGVRPVGDASLAAGLHPNTGVTFTFEDNDPNLPMPVPLYAAVLQIELSNVGPDTLIGVVLGTSFNVTTLNTARAAYLMSNGTNSVAHGVWMIDRPGKVAAPPAVRTAKSTAWTITHIFGSAPSIDAITVEKPMGFLPSSLRTEAPTPSEGGGSALLIGTIVGCVGALLLCVAAVAFFVIYRRKQDRQDDTANETKLNEFKDNGDAYDPYDTSADNTNTTPNLADFKTARGNGTVRNGNPAVAVVPHNRSGKPSATENALKNRFHELTSNQSPSVGGTTITNLHSPGRSATYDRVPQEGSVMYGQISDVKPTDTATQSVMYGALNDSGNQTGGITYGGLPHAPGASPRNDNDNNGVQYSTLAPSSSGPPMF